MATIAVQLKPGLVERLRETRRIESEEAFARLIGSDRTTLRRVMRGSQPSGSFMAGFCLAFGLGLGEAFEIVHPGQPTRRPSTPATATKQPLAA